MKKGYEYGGEIDAMEEADKAYRANKPPLKEMGDAGAAEAAGQFGDAGSSRTVKATPKAMPKAMPKAAPKPTAKAESKPAPKAAAADDTKMSVADRAKASRERARAGSGATDTRSVGERLRSAFAGKDRGGNSVDFGGTGLGMKSGGSVKPSKMSGVKTAKPSFGSASSRADGIASKGKTRGKYI
jgi:hypothetical protein